MRVLVTGAYGLIGSACLARLYAAGHDVIGAGRSIDAARRRAAYAQWIAADFARLADGAAWQPLLQNIDAVVNCVGVLQDSLRDDVERVQLAGTKALFDGCVGARATLPLDWVILRPALVLGSGVYGGSAMLRGIAAFPGFIPIFGGDARIQVIGLDDVAETAVRALVPGAPGRVVWDVAHPQAHAFEDIVTTIRAWQGFAPRPVVPLPHAAGKIVAAVADAIGWLGWRSPARSTSLAQLTEGVVGDPATWMAATGIAPKSLEQILAARPATVQDRWFARLYLLKPVAIFAIAATSIAIGVSTFIMYLRLAIFAWPLVTASIFAVDVLPGLIAGAFLLLVGVATLLRKTARAALITMLVLSMLGTSQNALMALASGQLSSTLLTFDIPAILALLFTLSILDER